METMNEGQKSDFANSFNDDALGAKLGNNQGLGFIGDVKAMWRYLKDQPTAGHVALILFALGYFISPIDGVPDPIPFVGLLDDAAVIAAAVASLGSVLDKYRN